MKSLIDRHSLWGWLPLLFLVPFLLAWDFVPFWKRVREIEDLRTLFEAVPESAAGCEIPFYGSATSEDRSPYLVVGVETEENPVNLIVDTGSPLSVVRDSLRKSLEAELVGHSPQLEAGKYEMVREVYRTSSLRLGGVRLVDEPVVFLPDEAFDRFGFSEFDGVLGATLLSRGVVEIETETHRIRLYPFDKGPEVDRKHSITMVHLWDLNYFVFALNTEQGGMGRFVLDTGTNYDLALKKSSTLAQRAMESERIEVWGLQDLMGFQKVPIYSLGENLTNSGLFYPKEMTVPVVDYESLPIDGMVGVSLVWNSKKVVLNAKEELVHIETREPLREKVVAGADRKRIAPMATE